MQFNKEDFEPISTTVLVRDTFSVTILVEDDSADGVEENNMRISLILPIRGLGCIKHTTEGELKDPDTSPSDVLKGTDVETVAESFVDHLIDTGSLNRSLATRDMAEIMSAITDGLEDDDEEL